MVLTNFILAEYDLAENKNKTIIPLIHSLLAVRNNQLNRNNI